MEQYVNLKLYRKNLDTYYIRKSILKALSENLPKFSGQILDVGCGKMPYKTYILENTKNTEYIGLDILSDYNLDNYFKPDFIWDGVTMPFQGNTFEVAMATEVLEHCSNPEILLKEVYRILQPGGMFFFTVPFLWNLHDVPNDEYRFTPFALKRLLKNSGFTNIEIKALGGWHASLAQMIGLWVRRSPMSGKKRKFLSILLKPLIKYLIKKDNTQIVEFTEGQMITGLYGSAYK